MNDLRFTDVASYGGIVLIQVDPTNLTRESEKGNDYASAQIGSVYLYSY